MKTPQNKELDHIITQLSEVMAKCGQERLERPSMMESEQWFKDRKIGEGLLRALAGTRQRRFSKLSFQNFGCTLSSRVSRVSAHSQNAAARSPSCATPALARHRHSA
ncbi:MAG TPA: hypothetical protein VFB63_13500 [Bryobacteraceae bacterium]|nr:hypothetical protein [Bryobacteraceae bacterium]